MTDPLRLETLQAAHAGCASLLEAYPGLPVLHSIQAQLDYLIALESGKIQDRSRLKNIIIGPLTAREVEALDDDVAELLYKAAAQAHLM